MAGSVSRSARPLTSSRSSPWPNLGNSLFRADATFCPENTADGFRLRSINLPDGYLRHYQAAGYVAAPGGARASDAQNSFDADVTLRAGPPLGI
ncbi:AbfB domain-containing protein [Micromonospora sp. M71_S20]|uniref:AbfB domain-containing protein n=1 Tax=Micromonospora sp. M71_S20 TaxID=592872 RepID=UPI00131599C4|nr:AbfB domain-containing protein [Micromonospora sp. M71_S20]